MTNKEAGRGNLWTKRKEGREYIKCVTTLPGGEESIDLFRVHHVPCVDCSGDGYVDGKKKKCPICLGSDSVLVLNNYEKQ